MIKKEDLRIVYMGTPDFAVPCLDILIKNGYNVVGVITATDKFGGRGGKKLIQSAVKKYALEHDLYIMQPKNLKNPAFQEELQSLKANLQVVVAFRMLPVAVWDMPSIGTINLHGSLLPKYRGAAPINWAVMNGETETGVTSFFLQHEIDTGDMLMQEKMPIGEIETVGEIHDRMMELGAEVILKSVDKIVVGNYELIPQDDTQVTKAPKIFHENCKIDFNQPSKKVHNFIRGLSPYPTAWTILDDLKLKIFLGEIELVEHNEMPGRIITNQKNSLKIATQDGFYVLKNIQLQKRKRMDVNSFLNGYKIENDEVE